MGETDTIEKWLSRHFISELVGEVRPLVIISKQCTILEAIEVRYRSFDHVTLIIPRHYQKTTFFALQLLTLKESS